MFAYYNKLSLKLNQTYSIYTTRGFLNKYIVCIILYFDQDFYYIIMEMRLSKSRLASAVFYVRKPAKTDDLNSSYAWMIKHKYIQTNSRYPSLDIGIGHHPRSNGSLQITMWATRDGSIKLATSKRFQSF